VRDRCTIGPVFPLTHRCVAGGRYYSSFGSKARALELLSKDMQYMALQFYSLLFGDASTRGGRRLWCATTGGSNGSLSVCADMGMNGIRNRPDAANAADIAFNSQCNDRWEAHQHTVAPAAADGEAKTRRAPPFCLSLQGMFQYFMGNGAFRAARALGLRAAGGD
jgi:hypothetical protein